MIGFRAKPEPVAAEPIVEPAKRSYLDANRKPVNPATDRCALAKLIDGPFPSTDVYFRNGKVPGLLGVRDRRSPHAIVWFAHDVTAAVLTYRFAPSVIA